MEAKPDSDTKTLLEHYKLLKPITSGRVGWLSNEEKTKLQKLWGLLLKEFTTSEDVPVLHSLTEPQTNDATKADATDSSNDLASLSFEPLVSISTKDEKSKPQQNAAKKQLQSGWISWAMGNSTPSTPISGASTPEQEDEETRRQRTETVKERMSRDGLQTAVGAKFVPLFGEQLLKRRFRTGFWQAATQIGDPDSWVLRFLRARNWDVEMALEMIRRTVIWRIGQAIDEISFYGESCLHHYTMESGLAFACTEDRLGNPVYIIRVRANVARARSILAIKRFLCWQIESSQMLATKSDGKVTMVFDFNGWCRENIDTKLVRTLITLLTNYYPETLGIVLLNVDSIIFSTLWTLISPFIDPNVKSKIVMTRNANELAPYIDPQMLVSELGGQKPFAYKYEMPTAEENLAMTDEQGRKTAEAAFVEAVAEYEKCTQQWLHNSNEEAPSLDDNGRAQAREALRKSAITLDPYIRARTLYHRFGFINKDHSVKF
ncbi:phosphatidylinositol transfer protein csr1 [Coemansia sp. RSA 1722]|nr:phosphatidylinositol transfer protein csr1 [Coemansia sp. RSA 1722]